MDMICRLYRLFTIFICLASVVVGFGSFAVLGCKDLWNNTNHLAKWYGHVMRCLELLSPCVSLKIIAHLRTFDSQSDSSIQRPHSIMPNNLQWAVTWELLSQGGEQICELKNKPNKNKPNKNKKYYHSKEKFTHWSASWIQFTESMIWLQLTVPLERKISSEIPISEIWLASHTNLPHGFRMLLLWCIFGA